MNPKFFYRVVAPTFVTKGTAFAGITTLGEDVAGKDDVARLLDKKTKTGRSLFKVILMSQVCDLCERNGTAKSCKHLQGEIPWWQDASRHGDLEDMMGQDHLEEYLRETKGFQVNLLNTPAFNHIVIDEIFDEKNDYRGVSHAKHVFMAIDPCAGGARSRFAAISTIYVNGEMVIVGLENANYKEPESQMELLINHIQAVRKLPGLESSRIVFVPESNYAFEGIHQEMALNRSGLSGVITMHEDENRAGIKSTNDLKKGMALAFRSKTNKRKVRFHHMFVCLTEGYTQDRAREEFVNQCKNFTREIKPNNDPHKAPTEFYRGKTGYGFDDLVMAAMINLIMKRRFFERTEAYKQYY